MPAPEPLVRTSLESRPDVAPEQNRGSTPTWGGAGRAAAAGAACVLAIFVAAAAATDGPGGADAANAFWDARDDGTEDGLRHVVYVGYDAASFDPDRAWSPDRLQDAFAAWWSSDADRVVERVDAVSHQGAVIGYRVTYTDRPLVPASALSGEPSSDHALQLPVVELDA